jgi:hypothetical protein
LRLPQRMERPAHLSLLIRPGVGTILPGDDGANARETRVFPHLVTAGLVVDGEPGLTEICAELADLAWHLASLHSSSEDSTAIRRAL